MVSLPVKKGGLAIPIFSAIADHEFANFRIAQGRIQDLVNGGFRQTSAYII